MDASSFARRAWNTPDRSGRGVSLDSAPPSTARPAAGGHLARAQARRGPPASHASTPVDTHALWSTAGRLELTCSQQAATRVPSVPGAAGRRGRALPGRPGAVHERSGERPQEGAGTCRAPRRREGQAPGSDTKELPAGDTSVLNHAGHRCHPHGHPGARYRPWTCFIQRGLWTAWQLTTNPEDHAHTVSVLSWGDISFKVGGPVSRAQARAGGGGGGAQCPSQLWAGE